MEPPSPDTRSLIPFCLRQKDISRENLLVFLESKGLTGEKAEGIIDTVLMADAGRRSARRKITEGAVILGVGLLGISYAMWKKVDGTVWLIWSVAGAGILVAGMIKRNKFKKYI